MKISNFFICENVENNNNNGKNVPLLIAPLTVIRPNNIPTNFSFGLAVGVNSVNLKNDNSIRFTINNPNGIVVHDSGENVFPKLIEDDGNLPDKYKGYTLVIDIRNLTIDIEGEYLFNLYINGTKLEEEIIPVYKAI